MANTMLVAPLLDNGVKMTSILLMVIIKFRNVLWLQLLFFTGKSLACVASVSVGFDGIFGILPARKMGREAKMNNGGWGRGMKEPLADKPLDFENLRSLANGARDWLG